MDSARSVKWAGALEKRLDDRQRLRRDCDESLLEELLSFLERLKDDGDEDEDEGMNPRILRRSEALRLRLVVVVSVVSRSLCEVLVSAVTGFRGWA